MRLRMLAIVLVFGCAPKPPRPAQIRISRGDDMTRCEQVGVVEERIESPTETEDLGEELRKAVRERAAALEATDLVIRKEEVEGNYAYALVDAFRCPR